MLPDPYQVRHMFCDLVHLILWGAAVLQCKGNILANRQPERRETAEGVTIALSAKAGEGIALLRQELLQLAGWHQTEDVFIARERHLVALRAASSHLLAAEAQLPRLELFAEEMRLAQPALCRITGEFTADDLLGEIFGRFCIGK